MNPVVWAKSLRVAITHGLIINCALRWPLCSYAPLVINSVRKFSAINPGHSENVGKDHDKASGKPYHAIEN